MLKRIYSFGCMSLCILSLSAQLKENPPAVTIISSSSIDPLTLRDSITIFYFNTLTLYKVSKPSIQSTLSSFEGGEATDSEKHIYQKTQYFAFRNSDKRGFSITNDSVIEITKTLSDFKEEALLKWSLDFVKSSDIIYTKNVDSNNIYNYIELYSFLPNSKSESPDSLILYYGQKFNEIEFNLTENDNFSHGYKLEKISLFYSLSRLLKSIHTSTKTIEYFSKLIKPSLSDYEIANKYCELLSKSIM